MLAALRDEDGNSMRCLGLMKIFAVCLFGLVLASNWCVAGPWKIKKDQWEAIDEARFSEFVQSLGAAVENMKPNGTCRDASRPCCNTVDSCFKSTANSYRASDPKDFRYFADCADFPYYVRAYFAWKNHLPFSMSTGISAIPPNKRDLRYSTYGNRITKRESIVAKDPTTFPNAIQFLRRLAGAISSGMYRYPPDLNADMADNDLFSDFYSPEISRASIKPGKTVVYDPSGHVGIVHKIDPFGRVYFIDAHPDNSLTNKLFGAAVGRSRPAHGAGFKNWRPMKLVGAREVNGSLIGGKIVSVPNPRISDYGVEQYYGNQPDSLGNWSKGQFVVNDQGKEKKVSFHDYARFKLKLQDPEITEEFVAMLDDICTAVKDRSWAVQEAVKNGLNRKAHPSNLPNNIYGTYGEWEEYSSPSRDARLKVTIRELLSRTEMMVAAYATKDPSFRYNGPNLAADLRRIYAEKSDDCRIRYENSAGQKVSLNLDEVILRIYDLSFDPYHCPELRWGALLGTDEFRTCPADNEKLRWYAAETGYRNQLDRTYDAKMGFSVEELLRAIDKSKRTGTDLPRGMGKMTGPDLNIRKYLSGL